MVKKPKVRLEQFKLIEDQIEFWNLRIAATKDILKLCKRARNTQVRGLKKLQKRYEV